MVKFLPCEPHLFSPCVIHQSQEFKWTHSSVMSCGFEKVERCMTCSLSWHCLLTDLGLASCAYWADNQSYRTTGSVQQEQESSPLISKQEINTRTGPNTLYLSSFSGFKKWSYRYLYHSFIELKFIHWMWFYSFKERFQRTFKGYNLVTVPFRMYRNNKATVILLFMLYTKDIWV